jgi:hypothetical protein
MTHGTSRPLRNEEGPWYITPIVKRKWLWHITPIAKRRMAIVHHAHCETKIGHGTSRPLQKENWPWYITPIAKGKWLHQHQKKNQIKVITSGEALRRMQNNIFECKTACTANESMRQNHLQNK